MSEGLLMVDRTQEEVARLEEATNLDEAARPEGATRKTSRPGTSNGKTLGSAQPRTATPNPGKTSRVQKGEKLPDTSVSPSTSQILLHNRVRPIALHISWYGFRTQARLARDSGISRAAVSRLVRYEAMPTLAVALRLTRSLSQRLNRPLDVWEVFSLDGTYPTASVCDLCGCRSCLPPEAYDSEDRLKPQYEQPAQDVWQVSDQSLVQQKGGK